MKNAFTMFFIIAISASLVFAQSETKKTNTGTTKINKTSATNAAVYDFTTSADKFYGGTSGAVEVETGVWGMIAGDANSDGFIDGSDFLGPDNDKFQSGYLNSDTGMDGFVDGSDFVPVDNNKFKGTAVPN